MAHTTCELTLVDAAGNSSTPTLTMPDFTVDTTPPRGPTIVTEVPTPNSGYDVKVTLKQAQDESGKFVFSGECSSTPEYDVTSSGDHEITLTLDNTTNGHIVDDCDVDFIDLAGNASTQHLQTAFGQAAPSDKKTLRAFTIASLNPVLIVESVKGIVGTTVGTTTKHINAKEGSIITIIVSTNKTLAAAPTITDGEYKIGGTVIPLTETERAFTIHRYQHDFR